MGDGLCVMLRFDLGGLSVELLSCFFFSLFAFDFVIVAGFLFSELCIDIGSFCYDDYFFYLFFDVAYLCIYFFLSFPIL